MAMPATQQMSRTQAVIHSWWILLTFTFFLNWAAFLYIGYRTRHQVWILAGGLYFAVVIQYFLVDGAIDNHGKIFGASVVLVLVAGVVSIVHGFLVRKEYIFRFEARKQVTPHSDFALQQRIASEYGVGGDSAKLQRSAEEKLAHCDQLVIQIEEQSVALELTPPDAPVRGQYTSALEVRSDAEQMLERATTPSELVDVNTKLSRASKGLQAVCNTLTSNTAP